MKSEWEKIKVMKSEDVNLHIEGEHLEEKIFGFLKWKVVICGSNVEEEQIWILIVKLQRDFDCSEDVNRVSFMTVMIKHLVEN